MQLISTRGQAQNASASEAMLRGIAPDGGLFVPSSFPELGDLAELAGLGYADLAAHVLSLFFSDIADISAITKAAYAGFDHPDVAPLKKLQDDEFVLELHHGPTLAFKDMALSVLPRLMTAAMAHKSGKDVLILVATSGDTGKAALEGFKDVPHTRIVVFYPDGGVSDMQRLQMITQGGENTHVVAVKGNFDDAQNGVKKLFANEDFAQAVGSSGYRLSSANSINFGRLAPQIAYYAWAYLQLMKKSEITQGDPVDFVVPTGNFGNILAAYYAKRMGLPVGKLICASNKNNVLTDFFNRGQYSLDRDFFKTMSPSMDILISSNLERLLFELAGRDTAAVRGMMEQLHKQGAYAIDGASKQALANDFWADWCSEEETRAAIKQIFEEYGYLIDTHTAVAMSVAQKYRQSSTANKTVVVSTASPYKFPADVLASLGEDVIGLGVFEQAALLSKRTNTKVPPQINALAEASVRHTASVEIDGMRDAVLNGYDHHRI